MRLLNKLIDSGEIGPCTAIGHDYVLVEKAGVVNVRRSSLKRGQFIMSLVQDDTVRFVRDLLAQPKGISGILSGTTKAAAPSQDRFVSAEQTRAQLGDLPEPMREAEAEMLRNLRETI